MKNIIFMSTVLLLSAVLSACGGGGESAAVETANPGKINPGTPKAGNLIIDNGRGTTNNQDTERVK